MGNILDRVGNDLRVEIKATANKMATILKTGGRTGMRKMTVEERALKFLQMTPMQRQTIKAQVGEDAWAQYEEQQVDFLYKRLGPAAVHLLPYVAPNLAMSLEEQAMSEEAV